MLLTITEQNFKAWTPKVIILIGEQLILDFGQRSNTFGLLSTCHRAKLTQVKEIDNPHRHHFNCSQCLQTVDVTMEDIIWAEIDDKHEGYAFQTGEFTQYSPADYSSVEQLIGHWFKRRPLANPLESLVYPSLITDTIREFNPSDYIQEMFLEDEANRRHYCDPYQQVAIG